MKKVYHFVSDPSHGWLKVDMEEIKRLEIYHVISTFSYQRNGVAYLEEDRDMSIFMEAKKAKGETVKIKEFNRNGRSRIRNYPMFGGERLVQRTNIMTGEKFYEAADRPRACSPSSETYWSM